MSINVARLHPLFGAEVTGVDFSGELEAETAKRLVELFDEYGVLLFRSQKITEEQHVRFSRHFGELEIHFLKQYLHPDHPELLFLSNVVENGRPIGVPDAGQFWHSDLSYVAQPSLGSLLYAVEIPIKDGVPLGDTMFASSAAAYDALPEKMKQRLDGLKAVHRYGGRHEKHLERGSKRKELTKEQKETPDPIHPVVRTHPRTGRKCLYVNEGFTIGIQGMSDEESLPLLKELFAHSVRPEFVYRHKWGVGDLLMFHNCLTQHNAIGDYPPSMRRVMRKTTLEGSPPV